MLNCKYLRTQQNIRKASFCRAMFLNVRAISVPRTKRKYLDFLSCKGLKFFTARPLKISPRFNSFKYVELKSEKQ